jgi:hypothetical protein
MLLRENLKIAILGVKGCVPRAKVKKVKVRENDGQGWEKVFRVRQKKYSKRKNVSREGRVLTLVPRREAKKEHGESWDFAIETRWLWKHLVEVILRIRARVFYTEGKNSLDDDLSLTKRRVLQLKKFFAKMQQEWFRRQQRLSLGAVKPLRPRPLLKREAQLNGLQVFFLLMLASFFLIHSLQRCK